MCKLQNHNDGNVESINYLPNTRSTCWFPIKSHYNTNYTLLVASNESGSMVDVIRCFDYHDCMQKVCLLANEPSVDMVTLGSIYGEIIDCN